MNVFIVVGPHGAGKTALCSKLMEAAGADEPLSYIDVAYKSASDYRNKMRMYIEAVQYGHDGRVIVDYAATTALEVAPYVRIAEAYGASVFVLVARSTVTACAERQTGDAPLDVIRRQVQRSETLRQDVASYLRCPVEEVFAPALTAHAQ